MAGLGFAGPLGVGTNVIANAGAGGADLANLAINLGAADTLGQSQVFAGSIGESPGAFNLGANLFGNANSNPNGPQPMNIVATGLGSSAINVIGNRNVLTSAGILNNTTNLGNPFGFPNGSDSVLTSTGNLSVAFNSQGFLTPACDALCGNNVSVTGPLALAGSINQVNETVVQNGFGVNINNFLTPPSSTNVLAASNPNKFVPTVFATGTGNRSGSPLSGSFTNAGKPFSSSLNQISSSLNSSLKKLSATINTVTKNLTGGLTARPKAGDSTNEE